MGNKKSSHMTTTGITGGIGSGKTTISKILTAMQYPVYIADTASKKLTDTHPLIKSGLIEMFGDNIFQNGQLNKKMLAGEIFTNKEKLQAVNQLIHPIVIQDFINWKQQQISRITFIETAILFETPFHQYVDKKILVTSPMELRIKRIQQRDYTSEQEIKARMNNQMSDDEKIKLSDFIIHNDEKTPVLPQIQNILEKILNS